VPGVVSHMKFGWPPGHLACASVLPACSPSKTALHFLHHLRRWRVRPRVSHSPWQYCHCTLPLTVIACHSLGIYTLALLSLLPFSVKMTVSPWASQPLSAPHQPLPLPRWRAPLACVAAHRGLTIPAAASTPTSRATAVGDFASPTFN
jgi:hypothetical protein